MSFRKFNSKSFAIQFCSETGLIPEINKIIAEYASSLEVFASPKDLKWNGFYTSGYWCKRPCINLRAGHWHCALTPEAGRIIVDCTKKLEPGWRGPESEQRKLIRNNFLAPDKQGYAICLERLRNILMWPKTTTGIEPYVLPLVRSEIGEEPDLRTYWWEDYDDYSRRTLYLTKNWDGLVDEIQLLIELYECLEDEYRPVEAHSDDEENEDEDEKEEESEESE